MLTAQQMKNLSNQRIHLWREETGYFLPIRPLHVLPRVSPESLLSRLAKNNKFCRLISETKRIKIVFCIYCFKKNIFLRFVKSEVKHSVANKALVVVGRQCVVGPPCWINSFGGAASAISS